MDLKEPFPRRIVVEGPDGAGKTRLIHEILGRFHYLHLIVNDRGPEQDLEHWWPAVLQSTPAGEVPIHDRFVYSELVYGPVLRGYVKVDGALVNEMLWVLRLTSMLIYCRPPIFDITQNEQLEGVAHKHEELVSQYDSLMDSERIYYPAGNYYVYDWTVPNALREVEHAVEAYLDSSPPLRHLPPSPAGSWSDG